MAQGKWNKKVVSDPHSALTYWYTVTKRCAGGGLGDTIGPKRTPERDMTVSVRRRAAAHLCHVILVEVSKAGQGRIQGWQRLI